MSADPLSLWTAYGVIFALTTGTNVINVDGEIIAFGVLDV
jgi:bacteriorhodopsin